MFKRSHIPVLLLALAVLASACSPTALTVEPQPQPRTMTVTGSGMVELIPDVAYIYIGVQTKNASAAEAVAENNSLAGRVAATLAGFDIASEDIQTTNFSIWPSDQYDENGNKTATLYVVDNTVYVAVRDMEIIGDLLDAIIRAGANSINGIQFDVEDKGPAISQARLAAVADAIQQAEQLAEAAGVTLGEVQIISYYDSIPVSYADYGKGGGYVGAMSVPVSAGQTQVTTTVTIVFELK
ncbi:MAG: DUF541 domain-containing protein [Chloroflexi bacterium]|nr:DUF541 domain-containing protein [Chloroflexota bacterium]